MGQPEPVDDPRLVLASVLLDGDESWTVCRALRDATGAVVDVTYLHASRTAEAAVGLGPLAGRRMLDIVPEAAGAVLPVMREAFETGERREVVFSSITRDGQWTWPGWTALTIRPHGDDAVVQWRDATTEHNSSLATRRTETRLRALLENAGEVIAVLSPDGSAPLYLSPSLPRVLGHTEPGGGLTARVHPDDKELVEQTFERLATGGPGEVAELEVRLQHADGRWLWVHARGTNHVSDPDVAGIVVNLWDVTERHGLAEQLRTQALEDPLTGLPNRRHIDAEVQRALLRTERTGACAGIVLCDVDHFKRVNDTWGHPAGDELLCLVAHRLRTVVRPTDTVGRLGGDEFVVVCEELSDPAELDAVTTRIQEALRGVYSVDGRDLAVTVTIGASCGDHTSSATELLSEADTALYEAKRTGRDRSQVFDHKVHLRSRDRTAKETALRRSVADGDLRLHFQPTVDLRSHAVTGAEALLRWQHPTRGLVHPAAFLPLAEESSLIVDIGRWVLGAAMAQAATWHHPANGSTSAAAPAPPAVSINVSGRHLTHPGLLQHLDEALSASGLDPHRVELEITETVVLQDLDLTGRVLREVRARGMRVALDDFGTGYSSLTWLQRLPVDTVKLDRSFIADLLSSGDSHTHDILRGVTSLAHALGKRVVAEGVETTEQHAMVLTLGCDHAQGFLYGRPAPGDPFTRPVWPAEAVKDA